MINEESAGKCPTNAHTYLPLPRYNCINIALQMLRFEWLVAAFNSVWMEREGLIRVRANFGCKSPSC